MMKESFLIAGEIYFLGFVIAMGMAALIKAIMFVIKRISHDEDKKEDETA
jgi:hypothetical protein